MFKNASSRKGFSVLSEGMRRNVQIRPGQVVPLKPQGAPVGVPRSWLSNGGMPNTPAADKDKQK